MGEMGWTNTYRARARRSLVAAKSRKWAPIAVLAITGMAAAACSGGADGAQGAGRATGGISIVVAAGRPEFVSGDSAVLSATASGKALSERQPITVDIDGKSETAATQPDARVVRGETTSATTLKLHELTPGTHKVRVSQGDRSGTVDLTVYDISGPMFSGAHLRPFVCTTEQNGLATTNDPDCMAPTEVTWSYVTTNDEVKALESPTDRPSDIAKATIDGIDVPMIVRTETGVINTAVYWISSLDPDGTVDAAANGAAPVANAGWNQRLIYQFGGGCGTSYSQGTPLLGGPPAMDIELLRRGYALATSTFNTFQVTCNDVLSAETALMVKEQVGELLGDVDLTIGAGGSGGAIQQLLMAQNYPGILDAVVATVPFPDHFSMASGVTDCGLLNRYFDTTGSALTEAQRTAISGHATSATCRSWQNLFLANIDPSTGCDGHIPATEIYSGANPDGVRCTLTDANINLLGTDPTTGFARRPLDNIGVEYGRVALKNGVIGVDEFLQLNESIGGYDIDGHIQPQRHAASVDDLRMLVNSGRVNSGGGDLGAIPILLLNIYSDPTGDIHDRFRSFEIRDRILAATGQAENVQLWTRGGGDLIAALTTAGRSYMIDMIVAADEWASALKSADNATQTGWWVGPNQPHGEDMDRDQLTSTMRASRPKAAQSNCDDSSGFRVEGDEAAKPDGPCAEKFPVAGNTRIAAGGPLSDDVWKCALRPVDTDGYGVAFTAAQAERLRSIFPDGVCDWSAPSPADSTFTKPWARYGP